MLGKRILLLISLTAGAGTIVLRAQVVPKNDSVKIYLAQPISDTLKVERIFNFIFGNAGGYDLNYCLDAAKKALQLAKRSNNRNALVSAHFLMGSEYNATQMLSDALTHLLQAVAIAEEKPYSNKMRLIQLYNNTGITYSQKEQHKKSIAYFKKALIISGQEKMRFQEAVFNNNIAIEYKEGKQYVEARKHLFAAANIIRELGREAILTNVMINVGTTFFENGEIDSAVYYYRTTLNLLKKYPNDAVLKTAFTNISEYHLYKHNYDSCIYYSLAAIAKADTINDKILLKSTYLHLAKAYGQKGDSKKSIYYVSLYSRVLETLYSDEEMKKMNEAENMFQAYKKRSEEELNRKNELIEQEQRKREKAIFWVMLVGSGILLIALYILYRRFREKKEANTLLISQKNEIEEKKKEITDSITYAERIQSALLTPTEKIDEYFPEHFILYLPRDIVSGDFYWADQVGNKKWMAVVDCTGHGVPGGFMSILSMNSLNRCIRELKLQTPAEVLNELSDIIAGSFTSLSGQSIRDGMDIALCCTYEQNGARILEYAGAHNPLWIISDNEVREYKANKRSVGYTETKTPFTNHLIALKKQDILYLFTDGFADQFGGPKGKKYKYSRLKEFLVLAPNESLIKQKELLESEIQKWRGDLEQVDDICVLGIKV
ncbi:MAG: SpoIIE family protein phosphatase [Flavobacteriales bacterium]